ncbi:MAG: DUF6057 family protein [Prolixibacteraceae bacterium]
MNQTKSIINLLFSGLPYLIFFLISFIYFGFFTDYILFYQEKSSLFFLSFDFLQENLRQPGGLLIYLGIFLSAFYIYPLAGAFIPAFILTSIVFTSSRIIARTSGKKPVLIPFFIGSALFYLHTDYHFFLFNSLGLLLQLTFFYLATKQTGSYRAWIPVLISPLWYFATGGFAWVFLLLIIIHFALLKERKYWIKIPVIGFLNLAFIFLSAQFLFFQSIKTLLTFPYTELGNSTQKALFFAVAISLSILPLITKVNLKLPAKSKLPELAESLGVSAVIAVVMVSIGIKHFEAKSKHYFTVEKLFYQQKFDELIAYNLANPTGNQLSIFLNNVALSETGQLNDLLFRFQQSPEGKTLFLKWSLESEVLKRGAYFYYTIGMYNEAQRWAFENMVMKGHTPEGLKMLIRTNLINENHKVASKYIRLLKQTLFYRNEAVLYEKLLFNDSALAADPELGKHWKNRIKTDFFSITDDPVVNIGLILASDSLNKKAFEYKLAFMLLNKDYKGIAHELPKMEKAGFKKLPVHIEEVAVALPALKTAIPDLGTIQLNNSTAEKWNRYLATFQQYGSDAKAAEPALRKDFGNTFWYYVFYR